VAPRACRKTFGPIAIRVLAGPRPEQVDIDDLDVRSLPLTYHLRDPLVDFYQDGRHLFLLLR